eukprot:13498155-Alexandrium_andersonii.AAC.1
MCIRDSPCLAHRHAARRPSRCGRSEGAGNCPEPPEPVGGGLPSRLPETGASSPSTVGRACRRSQRARRLCRAGRP